MEFGPVAVDQAEGAILAHSVMLNGQRLRKGLVLGAADIAGLRAAGVAQVVVARPGPEDVPEDAAAARLAAALVPDPAAAGLSLTDPFTGRVNLNSVAPGIVLLDTAAVHALNRIDPAITLATLAPFARVSAGTLVGTVKIITYAVPQTALMQAEALAQRAIRVQPVVRRSAGLLMTDVPGQEDKLIAKGRRAVAVECDVSEPDQIRRMFAQLDRDFGRKTFGDDGYAKEECCAELGAAFVGAILGLRPSHIEDHAAYIGSWLKVLKDDKRFIFTAAAMLSGRPTLCTPSRRLEWPD